MHLMVDRDIRVQTSPGQLQRALEGFRRSEGKSSTNRIYRLLTANITLKAGAVGLAGVIWAMSFLATGTTIRSVAVPIEFRDVPHGMEIAEQSADDLELQLRRSPWVIDSINPSRLIASFGMAHSHAGWNTLQLAPSALDLPPGVVVDRVTPTKIRVRITSENVPIPSG